MLAQIRRFLNEERAYAWMLVFIVTFFVFITCLTAVRRHTGSIEAKAPRAAELEKLAKIDEAALKAAISEKGLAGLFLTVAALSAVLAFLSGFVLFLIFSYLFMFRRSIFFAARPAPAAAWDLWDVARICIIFLFFAQVLFLAEFAVSPVFKAVGDENFRGVLNTAFLDLLAILLIVYFALAKYRQKLSSLGISFAAFLRNVIAGIAGYLAILPLLLGSLILVNLLSKIFKYAPKPEPVLMMFVREQRPLLLFCLVVLVVAIGPIAEEIFFRGFLYPALKDKLGMPRAVLLSALTFSWLHANVVGFLPIMILGILLAYLYERSGSIVSSVAVHVMHNSAMVALIFLLRALVKT